MKSKSVVVIALAVLAACTDRAGAPTMSVPANPQPSRVADWTARPDWKAYWRSESTLWVWDNTPEMGMITQTGALDEIDKMHTGLGVRIVRYRVNWKEYVQEEARDPACELVTFDGGDPSCTTAAVAHFVYWTKQRGMEPLLVVYNPPDGYTAGANTAHFVSFMQRLVTRFRGQVRFWQIWNEPDAGYGFDAVPFFGTKAEACSGNRYNMGYRYGQFMQSVYPAIKHADPGAWVLSAGMTGQEGWATDDTGRTEREGPYCDEKKQHVASALGNWTFLRGMYASGAAASFDFLALHDYGLPTDFRFGPKGHYLNQLLGEVGDSNRPVWVTEMGTSAHITSDHGRLLDAAQRASWRGTFDQQHRDWFVNAINTNRTERNYHKVFPYALQDSLGGRFYGPTAAQDFRDADAPNYGHGLFRFTPESGYKQPNLNDPRPAFAYLAGEANANRTAANIDASGGRNGAIQVPMYARVPAVHNFRYVGEPSANGTSQVEISLNAGTLVPTVVPVIIPVAFQVSQEGGAWSGEAFTGQTAGTAGSGAINGLRVRNGELPADIAICYTIGFRGTAAWEPEACNGAYAGGSGSGPLQAVTMRLIDPQNRGWSICYSAYVEGAGWTYPRQCDGWNAGWAGATLQAIRVWITRN